MRRLKTMTAERDPHLTLWNLGPQQVQVHFDGGRVVCDAGLLAVRALEKPLRIIADLAQRLPDPRSPQFIHHSVEALLTQQVYQLLAGYPDGNDAQTLRDDPLFQILADVSPDAEQPLASASTLTRFQYAYTRRQAELPPEERPARLEQRAAQTGRIKILNDYLVDLFLRTRPTPPTEVVLDIDASDDPVHGRQALSGYHGYFEQHQYFPLFVLDGVSGFPLAAWLRPGTVHASCGAVEVLAGLVARLRAAWPGVVIRVRADNGFGVPAVYDFCEREGLGYAIGYATNAVLQRATARAADDVELYYRFYGRRDPFVQRFEEVRDYQAESWPHARRIVAKIERTPQGGQRRFVVTNQPDRPEAVYRDFYVRRGAVPEQPIGELKNGLRADRLSACGFCANAFRLLLHVVAYAIVVLFREATAAIPETATAAVGTLRQRLWKVGAVVVTGARRIWLHVSETWPYRNLWVRVQEAVRVFVARLPGRAATAAVAAETPPR
jgi:Transposase DDE domain group 1